MMLADSVNSNTYLERVLLHCLGEEWRLRAEHNLMNFVLTSLGLDNAIGIIARIAEASDCC